MRKDSLRKNLSRPKLVGEAESKIRANSSVCGSQSQPSSTQKSAESRVRKSQFSTHRSTNPASSTQVHSKYDNIRHQIEYLDPALLVPKPGNPRIHPPKQIRKLSITIERFGFVDPVLIDSQQNIVAGHARVDAAKNLGLRAIPTIRIDHLSATELRALCLAANRVAEDADWDNALLAIELKELSIETEFDLTLTGFETAEIDFLIGQTPTAEDALPPVDPSELPVSQPGDLFRIGSHRILCGDALSPASYQVLLGRRKAQMIFTDPPYNVPINENAAGFGRAKYREFVQASGEMTSEEFTDFLGRFGTRVQAACSDGAVIFVCMDWRHTFELQNALIPIFGAPLNQCVWVKSNAGQGSLWRSQYELVLVFKRGTKPHINNVMLGKYGRSRTNVWTYAGANSFGKERDGALAMHPTVKPVSLVADSILDCSNRGGIILDCFAGSGTTLVAAQKTGRVGYGIEIDPLYVDVIIARFARLFGIDAIHEQSGLGFERLKRSRGTAMDFSRRRSRKAA